MGYLECTLVGERRLVDRVDQALRRVAADVIGIDELGVGATDNRLG